MYYHEQDENLSYDEAMEISLRIWKVIEDSARYSSLGRSR